jgi:cyclopropane fatty-acyl-phospholipid synthase-like methyltransferase
MKLKTKKITKCRLCKSKQLKKIYSFGNIYVSNFVKKNLYKNFPRAPLNLVSCKHCTLLQLQHSAPQELLYKKYYWYRSGVTQTMKYALKNIYESSKKFIKLNNDDTVLDIGANDGTLLKLFKNDCITIGCEPAKNLQKFLKKNCKHIINDFWSKKNFLNIQNKYRLKKPKIITAIGMFYDLEDPSKFIKDASEVLDDNGIFIAQLMCLKSMLEKNDLGNICHEHLEFYTYKSLLYLFEKNGLRIFKIEENNINGGSFRIYCKKNIEKSVRFKEKTSIKDIMSFISRINLIKKKCLKFIKSEIKKNKKIFLYGASTKGNTILQYFGLDKNLIPYAAERSPEKWGRYTIKTGIKIISENKARKFKPDYFFVMPWSFINEFIKREKKWLKKGGKFIVPFPKFKIIKK